MKFLFTTATTTTVIFLWLGTQLAQAQTYQLQSPNQAIKLSLLPADGPSGGWHLRAAYSKGGTETVALPHVQLGLQAGATDYLRGAKLTGSSKPTRINERYTAWHGKRRQCSNEATQQVFHFKNADNQRLSLVLRAYNNGIAFRYALPVNKGERVVLTDELTSYQLPATYDRFLQQAVSSYEGPYVKQSGAVKTGEWNYPALVNCGKDNPTCWVLLTEAGLDSTYCAGKLSNAQQADYYKVSYPSPSDGNHTGAVNPVIRAPWQSPWRVAIIGKLADIVESTLVEDVSSPSKIADSTWIKPGLSSWVYWANNHGTKDFKKLADYTDLAARMGWRYTLFDWEWAEMGNGGHVEDAAKYALSKGIKPLLWYNSGGPHNRVSATPRDRLLTHESRVKEFAWLKQLGICGIKVDFFESDKQNIIKYYLDILEDAATFNLLVNFHGATVPRGWSRTYPHLVSMEAVFGAEQYNNGVLMTTLAPAHNATLPFTRNVVGPMDYTPVTFTNSQNPHTTSSAHELALSVLFESGIQHMADRPEGYDALPDAPKTLLRTVPASWDDTKFVDGYPGKWVVMARRSGTTWYVGGINGENKRRKDVIGLQFLSTGKTYKATILKDGDFDTAFGVRYQVVSQTDALEISSLPRGGFTLVFQEQ